MPTDSADARWRAEARRHVRAATDPEPERAPWFRWLAAGAVAVATFCVLLLAAIGVQAGLGGDAAGVPSLPRLVVVLVAAAAAAGLVAWFRVPG